MTRVIPGLLELDEWQSQVTDSVFCISQNPGGVHEFVGAEFVLVLARMPDRRPVPRGWPSDVMFGFGDQANQTGSAVAVTSIGLPRGSRAGEVI